MVGKALAGAAFAAGLYIGRGVFAVDGFGEDTGAGGFAHTARTAKQVRMRQVVVPDRVFEGGSDMLLPHNRIKCLRTVLTRRYYIILCHAL